MKNLALALVASLMMGSSAFAECFDVMGTPISDIGPIQLRSPVYRVCKETIGTMSGREYYSLKFSDNLRDWAILSSQVEDRGRCPGFCRSYTLTSGYANGVVTDADGTNVVFNVQHGSGTLTVSHPHHGRVEHRIAPAVGKMR